MNKVCHYWLYNNNIRKESYTVTSTDRWNIHLTRKVGTRKHNAIISTSVLNKWSGINLWLEYECDDKVVDYYRDCLQQMLEKSIKTVESYKKRIENFTGKIIVKEP